MKHILRRITSVRVPILAGFLLIAAIARNLARLTDLPIALWDERLSTAAVERELIANDVSRARRAEVIDQHAAIFILQGALDRLANLKT